jgi:hypothetical protein
LPSHLVVFLVSFAALMSGAIASSLRAQVVGPFPDPTHSTATVEQPVVILVSPGGHGESLAELGVPIQIVLRDLDGVEITGYPPDDVFVLGVDASSSVCPGGTRADGPSDQEGRMSISGPFRAGGWTEGGVHVWAGGVQITEEPLAVRWVSPDMNGDHIINMVDIAEFAIAFADDYQFRADLTHDDVVDLRDLGEFALQFGMADNFCP